MKEETVTEFERLHVIAAVRLENLVSPKGITFQEYVQKKNNNNNTNFQIDTQEFVKLQHWVLNEFHGPYRVMKPHREPLKLSIHVKTTKVGETRLSPNSSE